MNLLSALALLFAATLKNRVRRTIKRLRQPRFLIATAAGLFYFWQLVFRRWFMLTRPVPASPLRDLVLGELRPAAEAGLIVLALIQILGAWIFGDERATLAFTEAEVQFFFPAPASRLALVNYKLLRGALWIVFVAFISAAFIGRAVSHRPLLFTLGAWIALTTTYLHRVASSFTRARLAERGRWGRVIVWAVITAVAVLAMIGLRNGFAAAPLRDGQEPFQQLAATAQAIMDAQPLSFLLAPVRAMIRPALAQDGAAFLRALPLALGILASQYVWAIATVAPFEEASAAAAEIRGRMMEARRGRRFGTPIKRRKAPWVLAGSGRPALALAWKNAVAVVRQFELRGFLLVGALFSLVFLLGTRSPDAGPVRMWMAAAGVAMLVLMGPVRLNTDLRHDIERFDILRSLPLSGREIVLSELLAPAALLAALEWILLAVGAFPGGDSGEITPEARVSVALTTALVAPALTLLGLVFQNAAALLFPDWMVVFRERRRGFEAMGQRLLTMVGSALVLALGGVPAALCGGLVLLLLWGPLGWAAAPIAGGLAAIVLTVEALLGVAWVGRLFETHDVANA